MHLTSILVERPSQHSIDRGAAREDLRDLRKMIAGKKGRNRGVCRHQRVDSGRQLEGTCP